MTKRTLTLALIAMTTAGFVAGVFVATRLISVQAQTKPGYGFAALAGERVGQDVDGPYEVDPNWPKPIYSVTGPRKMDLWRRGKRLRRKPQSRVHSRARRNSQPQAARGGSLPVGRSEHLVSRRRRCRGAMLPWDR